MKVLLILLATLKMSEPAKILVIVPTPVHSHQTTFHFISHQLATRGHQVTIVTTNPGILDENVPENLTEISIEEAGKSIFDKRVKFGVTKKEDYIEGRLEGTFVVQSESIDAALQIERVKRFIKKGDKFDLIIVEMFINSALIFAHIFKAPVVKLSTLISIFGNDEVIGSHVPQIWYPMSFSQRIYNLTVRETFSQLYNFYRINNFLTQQERRDYDIWKRRFGVSAPTTKDLNERVELLLVDAHPVWAFNKPFPSNAVFLGGGLHIRPPKELPKVGNGILSRIIF